MMVLTASASISDGVFGRRRDVIGIRIFIQLCEHSSEYKHFIRMTRSSSSIMMHQHPDVLLSRMDNMQNRCMLNRFCIVR
jgi:hypothetical protein